MKFESNGKELAGGEAAVAAAQLIVFGGATKILNSMMGTLQICVILALLTLTCPTWEGIPWLRTHAFSLGVALFSVQFLFGRRPVTTAGSISFHPFS